MSNVSNTINTRLSQLIGKYDLLTHPFYRSWSIGELTLAQLQLYAREYFHFVKLVPTFVSRIHSNCESHSIRLSILENLVEEETGGEGLIPHEELWIWFAQGIGVDRSELISAVPTSATRKLLLTFKNLCSASFCPVGAAAMYAYESRIPGIAESKLVGLKQFYSINDENTLRFFQEHILVDIEHAKTWEEIIAMMVETPEQQTQVEESTTKAARALWEFLDGVCEECGISLSNCTQ